MCIGLWRIAIEEAQDRGVGFRDRDRIQDGAVCIDATVIAQGLGIEAASVQSLMRGARLQVYAKLALMRSGATSGDVLCRGRRFRLIVDETGKIIWQSVTDFGDRLCPRLPKTRCVTGADKQSVFLATGPRVTAILSCRWQVEKFPWFHEQESQDQGAKGR